MAADAEFLHMEKKDNYSKADAFIKKHKLECNDDIWKLEGEAKAEYDELNYYVKLVLTSILYRKK